MGKIKRRIKMKKTDLKSGMTIKLRNDSVYLVVNDGLSRENGFEPLSLYRDNLTHINDKDYDIVEVYLYRNPFYGNTANLEDFLDLDDTGMELIWKRKELPKLSDVEKVILENLDKDYKVIARDKDGGLYIYSSKPKKDDCVWWGIAIILSELKGFNHLFKFVKWEDEEPYNIEELLKGE